MADPTATPFTGFPAAMTAWFLGLEEDNSRRYFEEHRATYDRDVRGALEALLDELADEVGGVAKLFRQHRDLRFSADKSPYKTRTYGVVRARPDDPALFAGISADGLFAGSGIYGFAPDQLTRYRDAVVDDAAGRALERALEPATAAGLEIHGEALATAPRGYPRDHARAGLLRHKALYAGRRLAPGPDGISRSAAIDHVRGAWGACAPMNAWLAAHVGASELPARRR